MGVLKRGDKGSKVKQMQSLLQKSGAKPTVKPTGTFCPLTEQAVKDFQKRNKLKADGIVGNGTLEMLQDAQEKDVKWTVKDTNKPRQELDKIIAQRTRYDTWVDDEQKRLIGTKDKKINVLRKKFDDAGKMFYDKAFELRDALYAVVRLKREFDYAKTKQQQRELLDKAKDQFAQAEKLNTAAEKLKKKSDTADIALMLELQPLFDAA